MPAAVWLTVTLVPGSARKPVIPGGMGGSRSTGSGQRKMCKVDQIPPVRAAAPPAVLRDRESPRVGRDPVFVRRQERVAAGHVYALAHFV